MSNIAIHSGLIGIGCANAWDIILNQNIVQPKNNIIIPIIEKVPIATNASVIFVIAFAQLIVPVLPKQEANILEIDENNPTSVTTICFSTVVAFTLFVPPVAGATWREEEEEVGVTTAGEGIVVVTVAVFVVATGTWVDPVTTGIGWTSSGHVVTSVPSSTHIRHAVVSTNRALYRSALMRPVPVDCSFVHNLYDPSNASDSQNTLPSFVVKKAVVAYDCSPKIQREIQAQIIKNNIFFIVQMEWGK